MIKIRKEYYKALEKYGASGVLNLYRDNKISLNEKEWQSLHKKIESQKNMYYEDRIKTIFSSIICFLLLIIICINFNLRNTEEKIFECQKRTGHICTKYEIEKMEVMK